MAKRTTENSNVSLADRIWQQASAPHTEGETYYDTVLLAAGEQVVKNLQTAMGYLRRIIESKCP